jgi:DMSO/TMAO reductase YedYZ heme-binding membrane subunit
VSSHALWFATRGFGVVSLLLLTAIVVLGVASATRWKSARWPRFVVAGLHRNLTLLALVFIASHVITTVADGFAPISFLNAVLPFTSAYRPVWLGLGAVAFDLLLALTITSLLRARIGYGRWRALHWLAYASWPIALVHGLGTGTTRGSRGCRPSRSEASRVSSARCSGAWPRAGPRPRCGREASWRCSRSHS